MVWQISESSQGIQFKENLAIRESARKAFHAADNSAALRRAMLSRNTTSSWSICSRRMDNVMENYGKSEGLVWSYAGGGQSFTKAKVLCG